MGIKLGETTLHLSEHHGDCTPGSSIRIQVDGIHDYYALIADKPYRFYNPSVDEMPWNTLDMQVMDPFGNKIIFWEEAAENK